jgi:hypothetical protein
MNEIDNEPFGKLWEKEMMKWSKKMLIDFLKEQLIKLQEDELPSEILGASSGKTHQEAHDNLLHSILSGAGEKI